jgi:hypothetical protein
VTSPEATAVARLAHAAVFVSATDSCLRGELGQPVDFLDLDVEDSTLLRQVICVLTQFRHVDRSNHAQLRPQHDGKLRRQGSNLRLAINSRASCRSTTPERRVATAT